jgi:hypothetical protein
VIRFFKSNDWRYVIIDDRLPAKRNKNGELELIYAKNQYKSEFWASLIEKAYAKLHYSYEALVSGYHDDALTDLIGIPTQKYKITKHRQKRYYMKSIGGKEKIWNLLKYNICMRNYM